MRKFLVLMGAAALAAAALPQGAITDGDVTYTFAGVTGAAIRTGTGGGANSFRVMPGGSDHLFQNWWWYRVEGVNTREFAFSTLTAQSYTGDTAVLNFVEPEGIAAEMRYVVDDPGDNKGTFVATMMVTNNGTSAVRLHLFNYIDWDVSATFAEDSATLINPLPDALIRITDSSTTDFAEFAGTGVTAYQVTFYSSLRNLLTDGAVTDLNNTGLPFGPDDFTGAYQWSFDLAPGASVTVTERGGVNVPPAEILVRPSSFSFFRGVLVSGTLVSLHFSDDDRLVGRPGVVLNQAERPIQIVIEGAAPGATASQIKIVVEAHCNIPNINQQIDEFDFVAASYTQVDSRLAPTADLRLELVLPGTANNYIGPGNVLRARISYKEAGPVFSYPWLARIDEATWRVTP